MTIFNECNIVNLLETTLFNAAAVESLGDAAVDLADYCVRQMTTITVGEAAANDAEYERKGPTGTQISPQRTATLSIFHAFLAYSGILGRVSHVIQILSSYRKYD